MKAFHEVRSYTTDLMVWHREFENISFIAHWHREIELLYVKRGSIRVQVANRNFTAREGDLIVCDSGDIHHSNFCEQGAILDFVIFDTSLIGSRYKHNHFSENRIPAEKMRETGLDILLEELEKTIDEELAGRREHYRELITASIRGFWYRMLRCMDTETDTSVMKDRRSNLQADFQNLLSYMEDHASEPLPLEAAAAMMHFSPSHFSRVFKQQIGIGYVKYLNLIRVTQASELLRESDMTISQIAFSCGFQNVRSFNRVFREITGRTPSEQLSDPDLQAQNFTYYRSNENINMDAEKDPETIVKEVQ